MAPRPPRKIPEFTEVDYKTKAGVAWSHNYLNQKPWHPMSYPNQRRKWIAEQEHAVREQHREVAAKEVGLCKQRIRLQFWESPYMSR